MESFPPISRSYGQAQRALKDFLKATEEVLAHLPEQPSCGSTIREVVRQNNANLLLRFDECLVSLGHCCGNIPKPGAEYSEDCKGLSMKGTLVLRAITSVMTALTPLLSCAEPDATEKLSNGFALHMAIGQLKALQESLK